MTDFNAWRDPWIHVVMNDGQQRVVGIGECLLCAQDIRQLTDVSPSVVAGTHRLLTAILQYCYRPRSISDINAILSCGSFDDRLTSFASEYLARFDLFSSSSPFLQTSEDVTDTAVSPISRMFLELPGQSTPVFHGHHNRMSSDIAACPSCCTAGLVAITAFIPGTGGGFRLPINAVSQGVIYVLPDGDTLFHSLVLSLTTRDFQPKAADPQREDVALWNQDTVIPCKIERADVGYIESLTFPVRQIRLYPEQTSSHCGICGQCTETIVPTMHFQQGWYMSETVRGIWRDPFISWRMGKEKAKRIALREGQSLWRDSVGILLSRSGRAPIVDQIGFMIDRDMLSSAHELRFRCVGVRSKQAEIHEWIDETITLSPSLVNNDAAIYVMEQAMERANEVQWVLSKAFKSIYPVTISRERSANIRSHMLSSYWASLAPTFREMIRQSTSFLDIEQQWANTVLTAGENAFDTHTQGIRDFIPLAKARSYLGVLIGKKRKEWLHDTE